MTPTPRDRLIAAIIEALREEDPFEETPEERATRILHHAIQPSLHHYALTVLAASDQALGTHLDLLEEWFQWWAGNDALNKMPNSLHTRTATALAIAGRPHFVNIPTGDAKPQVGDGLHETDER